MINTAYIEFKDNLPINENCYSALYGFEQEGTEVKPFTIEELISGKLPLTKETLVHGSVTSVRMSLKQIGYKIPECLGLPKSLAQFYHRKIYIGATLKDIRNQHVTWPIFIKPLKQHKAFTGYIVKDFKDLIETAPLDDSLEVIAQEVVEFGSEWRVFVLKGEILGIRQYKGSCEWFPNVSTIKEIIRTYEKEEQQNHPIAYSVDVGWRKYRDYNTLNYKEREDLQMDGWTYCGRVRDVTALVEINDAFALGNYGLPSHLYIKMIKERWEEMVRDATKP